MSTTQKNRIPSVLRSHLNKAHLFAGSLLLTVVLVAVGCGLEPDRTLETETITGQLTTLPPFSEEQGTSTCPAGNAVRGIACTGSYCDNLQLTCDEFPGSILSGFTYTPWFSEENPSHQTCEANQVVTKMQCSGKYCDNIRLKCQPTNQTLFNCVWNGPYSEEQPGWDAGDNRFLQGVWCSGRYCDNKWYLSCEAHRSTATCENHCGGYSDGCWCDRFCQQYGDCCSDYLTYCGP